MELISDANVAYKYSSVNLLKLNDIYLYNKEHFKDVT